MKIAKMKKDSTHHLFLTLILTFLLVGCNSDDDHIDDGFNGETKEYKLEPEGNSSVEGTVTFIENENGSTNIEIEVNGTEDGETYSPQLLYGNSIDGGDLALSLEDIEGDEGKSSTTISKLDDNSAVKFEDFIEMEGHIVIYLVGEEDETKVASGDIGENELTEESVTYELEALGDNGIAATVKFEERLNGTTLVTISSEDAEEGDTHPAYILSGPAGDDRVSKVISLNPLQSGISITNISTLDEVDNEEGENINYEDLVEFDGSINIYLSEEQDEIIISQGNIGSNIED